MKARAEEEWKKEEQKNEFQHMAQLKLATIVQKEKYDLECPELKRYQKKHVSAIQWQSQNLDDHSAYLTSVWQDRYLYPHGNVMACKSMPLVRRGLTLL